MLLHPQVLAVQGIMADSFDPYHKWLGIPPKDQPPNHYRLLGLDLFENDPEVIEAAANRQMNYIQGCATGPHVAHSQKILNEITAARLALLEAAKKSKYDDKLRQGLSPKVKVVQAAVGVPASVRKPAPKATAAPAVRSVATAAPAEAFDFAATTPQKSKAVAGKRGRTKVSIGWQLPVFIVLAIGLVIGGLIIADSVSGPGQSEDNLGGGQSNVVIERPDPTTRPSPPRPAPIPDREEPPEEAPEKPAAEPEDGAEPDDEKPPPDEQDTTNSKRPPQEFPQPGQNLDDLKEPTEPVDKPAPQDEPDEPPVEEPEEMEPVRRELATVPDARELREGEKRVDERLGPAPRRRGEKLPAAQRLLANVGVFDTDPAAAYALLERARDLAASDGGLGVALGAIDAMAERFEIDAMQMKSDAVEQATKLIRKADDPEAETIKVAGKTLLEEAIRLDRFDVASETMKSLGVLAGRIGDRDLRKYLGGQADLVQDGERRFKTIAAAKEKLEENPDDPGANLTLGLYLSLIKGDWVAGPPYLANSEDAAIQAAAAAEMKVPSEAAGQRAAGEAWLEVLKKSRRGLPFDVGDRIRARGQHWMFQAHANAQQADKVEIEKSLGEANILRINSIGMRLVLIPPGEFLMGSPPEERGRESFKWKDSISQKEFVIKETQHPVRISRPYYMGMYEVTQEEFQRVTNSNPSIGVKAPRLPVTNVKWGIAGKFCQALSVKEKEVYRLPTEAEWEYACRAGMTSPFAFGETLSTADAQISPNKEPAEVGSFRPNGFGLYDMHGNALEWCQDYFKRGYYEILVGRLTIDPPGPSQGQMRMMRGGGFEYSKNLCRSASRRASNPVGNNPMYGFRVVMEIR